MIIKENEIRTKQLNLLMCKMKQLEEGNIVFEFKSGKRIENVPLEMFVEMINKFSEGCAPKLHIAMK